MRTLTTAMVIWCALCAGWALGGERGAADAFEPFDLSAPVQGPLAVGGQLAPMRPELAPPRRPPPACLSREPAPARLIRQAWRTAGLLEDEDRRRRSRLDWSAWLPKLGASVAMDLGDRWDYRYEPGSPRVDQLHQDDGWRWDLSLDWDLSRLVFQKEELQLVREEERRALLRRSLAVEVARMVWRRKRLLLAGLPEPGSLAWAQIEELSAVLDAWTGGRFRGQWCAERRKR